MVILATFQSPHSIRVALMSSSRLGPVGSRGKPGRLFAASKTSAARTQTISRFVAVHLEDSGKLHDTSKTRDLLIPVSVYVRMARTIRSE